MKNFWIFVKDKKTCPWLALNEVWITNLWVLNLKEEDNLNHLLFNILAISLHPIQNKNHYPKKDNKGEGIFFF